MITERNFACIRTSVTMSRRLIVIKQSCMRCFAIINPCFVIRATYIKMLTFYFYEKFVFIV